MTKLMIVFAVGFIFVICLLSIFMVITQPDGDHERLPNPDYQKEVEEYNNRSAVCDWDYMTMCYNYQKAKNISFECFK